MDEAGTKKAAEEQTKEAAADEGLYHGSIIRGSSHRDGAINSSKAMHAVKTNYGFDIADRTETELHDPECGWDLESGMMQIFSLELAETPAGSGPAVQLYGYVAARDEVDYKLNYVFNRGRDDPVTVRRGSLIEMTGPTRPIVLYCDVLLEFDVRIRNGDREDDDLQLIDGASFFHGLHMQCRPRKVRFDGGDCGGAVDMSYASVDAGVEAIVDVVVSEVKTGFDLSLSSILSFEEVQVLGEPLRKEFHLFRGAVGEPCGLRRFVVAVGMGTEMHLKFKIGHKGSESDIERTCSFKAQLKGDASHQINLEVASILVKVTWATLPI
jgi:hypothetical protein